MSSSTENGCATAIAQIIVHFLLMCLAAGIVQFVVLEMFNYNINFWPLVGLLWVTGFVIRLIK